MADQFAELQGRACVLAKIDTESWMQFAAREMHFCDCWSLSSDGQTLTMEHRNDDLAGQLTILDRVG